jgi:copper transporter 1
MDGHDHSQMEHGGGSMSSMAMTFHRSVHAVVLFDWLETTDHLSFLVVCALVFAMGVARQRLAVELTLSGASRGHSRDMRSVIYGTNMLLNYLLMLVAMTYNVGLFIAVILGLTYGYHKYQNTQGEASHVMLFACFPSKS